MDYKHIPTVQPSKKFDIDKDAAALRKAMKGLGTDEQVIINVLTALSNDQRQKLMDHYNGTLDRDLIKDLKSELSGRFEDVILGLMMPPIEYLCKRMHDAMKCLSLNKAENVLVEALYPRSNEEIAKIVICYEDMYEDCTLVEDIRTTTHTNDFRLMLTSLLTLARDPENSVDEAKAKVHAEELLSLGKGELHPSQDFFYRMLAKCSFAQLRLIFSIYKDLSGHSIQDAIKRGMNQFQDIMLSAVRPAKNFDVDKDAEGLRNAMKGLGTNEQAIIDILTSVSNDQRQKLKEHYNTKLKRDLLKDLKSEISGDFKAVVKALMKPSVEFICKELNKALRGIYAIDQVVLETMFTKSREEITEISNCYKIMYGGSSLVNEIRTRTISVFRPILTLIAEGVRNSPDSAVDGAKAKKQAESLLALGKGSFTYKEDLFYRLLVLENFPQLLIVFSKYNGLAGHSVEDAIKRGGMDGFQCFLQSMVECVQSPPAFFATRLFKAMDGAGTDDTTLIRIIVSRSEIDLGNIKEEFERLYNRTLVSAVKSETSGDYKRALCALIGGA